VDLVHDGDREVADVCPTPDQRPIPGDTGRVVTDTLGKVERLERRLAGAALATEKGVDKRPGRQPGFVDEQRN
jgi:hypothetical protein